MNKILLIARNAIARSKIFVLLSVLAGVMVCLAYLGGWHSAIDFSGNGTIDIGVVDMDDSFLSQHFRTYLTENLGMNILDETDYDELTKVLIDMDLSVIIEVPEGFEASALAGEFQKLTLTTTNDYENTAFIQAYIDTYMQGVSAASKTANGDAELFERILDSASADSEPLAMESAVVTSREAEQSAAAFRFAAGFYMMLVMAVAICVNFLVVTDKKQNTLDRMRISAVGSLEYVLGTVLSCVLICAPTAVIPLAFIAISGDSIGISFPLAIVYFILFLLFAVGFALVTSLLFSSMETIVPVMIGFASIGCILGGAWFPIDNTIGALHLVSYLMPQYWIMNYIDSVQENTIVSLTADSSALTCVGILVLFVVLMYLTAAVCYGKKRIK